MANPIIEVKELSKIYRRDQHEIHPLKNLKLMINKGDFLALVGPSGSGKTTLLNIIAGIDKPTSGSVLFEGIDITRMSKKELAKWRNEHIGFVFQSFNLIPVLTARENVELPLLLTGLSKKERNEHVLSALKIVGLADRADHYPRQLSGGQEQRVAIARAIVTDPTVIVADEPTGELDAESAEDILALLRECNQRFEKTIVMVTHDARAVKYARAVKTLDKGELFDGQRMVQGVAL